MEFDLSKRHCYYFNEIAKIPRGSRNEKAISDYICAFAEAHGLPYRQDEVYNVTIDKPASPGYENSAPVILQAHIDMVCEKNSDVEHDFEKDPLDLYVEDGWLKARGTTLGADDGDGVAYMLAILEDETAEHPPLECIFTTMEEIGLIGSQHLRKEDLHGHRCISLDGSGLCSTTVSSAGSAVAVISAKPDFRTANLPEYVLRIRGLEGGHSGSKIDRELGNANILAGRILREAELAGLDITLSHLTGGNKENAIPREADFAFVSASDPAALKAAVFAAIGDIKRELAESDPGFSAELTEGDGCGKCMDSSASKSLLNFLFLMPHGFLHKSMSIPGLTTASLNLGVIRTDDTAVKLQIMARSALDSHLNLIRNQLKVLAELTGLDADLPEGYPGWPYDAHSELRAVYRRVLEKHGLVLSENATHGGLECGVIKGLDPDMDIITFGPVYEDIHSPSERLDLQSFDEAFVILKEILKECR